MNQMLEEQLEEAIQEGINLERERVGALLQLLTPETQTVVVEAILSGKQPGDIFAECVSLTRPSAQVQQISDDESALRARTAIVRKAFARAAQRVGTRTHDGDR